MATKWTFWAPFLRFRQTIIGNFWLKKCVEYSKDLIKNHFQISTNLYREYYVFEANQQNKIASIKTKKMTSQTLDSIYFSRCIGYFNKPVRYLMQPERTNVGSIPKIRGSESNLEWSICISFMTCVTSINRVFVFVLHIPRKEADILRKTISTIQLVMFDAYDDLDGVMVQAYIYLCGKIGTLMRSYFVVVGCRSMRSSVVDVVDGYSCRLFTSTHNYPRLKSTEYIHNTPPKIDNHFP